MFTCDKLRVQNVLENALEKLSEGLKLQNFPGGACMPPDAPSFCARTFSPPAQKHLPTPLIVAHAKAPQGPKNRTCYMYFQDKLRVIPAQSILEVWYVLSPSPPHITTHACHTIEHSTTLILTHLSYREHSIVLYT